MHVTYPEQRAYQPTLLGRVRAVIAAFACLGIALAGCSNGADNDAADTDAADTAAVSGDVGTTADNDSGGPVGLAEGIIETLLVTDHCVGSGAAMFTDVTAKSGVLHRHRSRPTAAYYHRSYGGGGVLEDLDDDGDLDLYLSNANGPNRLFVNRGDGVFYLATHAGEVAFSADATIGVSAADLDGDGRVDLYLANQGPDRLLRNMGGMRFVDVSAASGLRSVSDNSTSASFCDLDGDGDLDAFVGGAVKSLGLTVSATEAGRSRLWRNDGKMHFTDRSDSVAKTGVIAGASFIGVCADLDGDGDADILHTQEFGKRIAKAAVYRNESANGSEGLSFANVSANAQVGEPQAVMGAALMANPIGRFDVALSNLVQSDKLGREGLLRSDTKLQFTEVGGPLGAHAMTTTAVSKQGPRGSSWAMLAEDFDNDGDEDLYIAYGNLPIPSPGDDEYDLPISLWSGPRYTPSQPNALLLRGADGNFKVRDGACVEDTASTRGALAGDIDGDGCLDLITVALNGPVRVLHNLCTAGNTWLSVSLNAKGANRRAVGAVVELSDDGATQRRAVLAGSQSVFSALPVRVHFGLGKAASESTTRSLSVRWPGGKVTKHAVPLANRHLVLAQP